MEASRTLTMFTRLGFAARGLLYIIIAWLVLRSDRTEDPSGALDHLAQNGGRPLLFAMAAGFIAYGLWRLADAALNIEGHEPGNKGTAQRLAAAGSGIIYSFLAVQAVRLIQHEGRSSSGGGGGGTEEGARAALELPGGEILLILGGAVLLFAGVFQLIKAAKCSFCRKLEPSVATKDWVKWTGRAGYSARGIVFLVSGYFLVKAGLDARASEAGGMAEALSWLDDPWDKLVAAGLFLFGLFSLVEARFRIIHRVPLEELGDAARGHMPG